MGVRMLHWHETDTKRKRAKGMLVLKHMFTAEQIKSDPLYSAELKRYGFMLSGLLDCLLAYLLTCLLAG